MLSVKWRPFCPGEDELSSHKRHPSSSSSLWIDIILKSHERHDISNHLWLDSFNSLFTLTVKKVKALLSICEGINWWPTEPLNKGLVMQKVFPCHDIIMKSYDKWFLFFFTHPPTHPFSLTTVASVVCQIIGKQFIWANNNNTEALYYRSLTECPHHVSVYMLIPNPSWSQVCSYVMW